MINRIILYPFKNKNKTENKNNMENTIIKITDFQKSLAKESEDLKELGDILLNTLKKYEKGEVTRHQLLAYTLAGNTAYKAIFGKFIIDQALIVENAIEV